MIVKEINIKIQASNPFEAKAKEEYLQVLSSLDNETLSKINEVLKSKNAISQFNNNFQLLKSFLK